MTWLYLSTLPETAYMPSARFFAESQTTGTRQTSYLPSADTQTLGKDYAHGTFHFCRVPALGKSPTLGIKYLCRVPQGRHSATFAHVAAACASRQTGWRPLLFAECRLSGTRQIRIFTECFFKALGKVCFAECISLALGKYLNFFHCRPQNFLYPIHTTCGTPCSNLVYFLMYFIYFMN